MGANFVEALSCLEFTFWKVESTRTNLVDRLPWAELLGTSKNRKELTHLLPFLCDIVTFSADAPSNVKASRSSSYEYLLKAFIIQIDMYRELFKYIGA